MRDVFGETDNRALFAGHETFPLRLLWLRKAYDGVRDGASSRTFQEPDAIGRFGVGKNMALSMRFWALAAGIIEDSAGTLRPTPLGDAIFGVNGWDPYLEQAPTIWTVHAHLAGQPYMATTIFYAFSGLNSPDFDVPTLVRSLEGVVEKKGWRATTGTLRRDVEVLLRSYVPRADPSNEDAAEPLMAELGLIREARVGGYFEFVRGPKPSLPDAVFVYALHRFWRRKHPGLTALTLEQVCYGPGAPGRIFKLNEDEVATRLSRIETATGGAWRFTDTAGLRQVQKASEIDPLMVLEGAYLRRAA